MKKILLILFVCVAFVANAQETEKDSSGIMTLTIPIETSGSDTIEVYLLVSDTAQLNHLVAVHGYEVRTARLVKVNKASVPKSPYPYWTHLVHVISAWVYTTVYEHKEYLDPYKRPFRPQVIIWQSVQKGQEQTIKSNQ